MPIVRAATVSDVPTILDLVRQLATYEREPNAVTATEEDFIKHGFGPNPRYRALIAEDEAPVGFALFFFGFSTWTGGPILYLEDLFVIPEARKQGTGIALMKVLARIAVDEGCTRFVWQVLDWNEPAIRFYESLGAKLLREWQTVRIDGDALAKLASA